jgi:hypothetical protein
LISGEIVAEDRPEDVVKERRSYMGKYLKDLLGQKAGTEGGSGGENAIQSMCSISSCDSWLLYILPSDGRFV